MITKSETQHNCVCVCVCVRERERETLQNDGASVDLISSSNTAVIRDQTYL